MIATLPCAQQHQMDTMIKKRLILRGIAAYLSHKFFCNDCDSRITIWNAHIDGSEMYYIISMHTGRPMVKNGISIRYTGVINDDNEPGLFDLEPIQAIAAWAGSCEIALHWSDETGEVAGPFARACVDDIPAVAENAELVRDQDGAIVRDKRRRRDPYASAAKAELRKEVRRLRSVRGDQLGSASNETVDSVWQPTPSSDVVLYPKTTESNADSEARSSAPPEVAATADDMDRAAALLNTPLSELDLPLVEIGIGFARLKGDRLQVEAAVLVRRRAFTVLAKLSELLSVNVAEYRFELISYLRRLPSASFWVEHNDSTMMFILKAAQNRMGARRTKSAPY